MDFVQRNLINERNNLQIELAKAKLLIAQLSEEKKIVGEKPKQAPYGEKPKAEQGKNGKYEPKETPKPKSMSEEHDLSDPSLIYHSERRDGVTPDAATLRLRARERADHAKSLKDTEPKKLGIGTDGKKMTRAATEIERAQGDHLLAAARVVGPARAARISAGSCELGCGAREQRHRERRRARASQ
jgi:hypothetical protein